MTRTRDKGSIGGQHVVLCILVVIELCVIIIGFCVWGCEGLSWRRFVPHYMIVSVVCVWFVRVLSWWRFVPQYMYIIIFIIIICVSCVSCVVRVCIGGGSYLTIVF